MKECKKIKVLLPALIETKEQKEMFERSYKSALSFENCAKVYVNHDRFETKVAGAWNALLDAWRGKEYDYLMITASDVEHDPMCIDFLVRCAEENPNAGIISTKVERDYDKFIQGFGQQEYTSKLTEDQPKDPATFLIRKGVMEKIGRVDEQFPGAFVERDLIYRAKLAGFDWVQPDIILEYHPPFSGTLGNDEIELQKALKRYMLKFGGDANQEQFKHPYNNLSLDFTYCEK